VRKRLRRCATRRSSSTRCRSWCSCTCASTATAAASGRTRRCAATSPTQAAARAAHKLRALGLHHAQQAAGRGAAAPPTTTWSPASARCAPGGARRDPPRPGRQRDHGAARDRSGARWSGQAYKHLLGLALERGPLSREDAEAELRRWAAETGAGLALGRVHAGESAGARRCCACAPSRPARLQPARAREEPRGPAVRRRGERASATAAT
jgi:hypothetical protein